MCVSVWLSCPQPDCAPLPIPIFQLEISRPWQAAATAQLQRKEERTREEEKEEEKAGWLKRRMLLWELSLLQKMFFVTFLSFADLKSFLCRAGADRCLSRSRRAARQAGARARPGGKRPAPSTFWCSSRAWQDLAWPHYLVMSLEKYGPPERGSGTWTDENRKGNGSWQQAHAKAVGAKEESERYKSRKGIEREKEERCWQIWKNRETVGTAGVWRGVAKLMALPGQIAVDHSSLNKSSGLRRIFKKCLFN